MIPQPYALPRAVFPYTKTVGVKSVIDDLRETAFGVEYGSNGDVISVDEWEPFMSVQVFLDGEDKLHVTDYEL
jgi:hypothetical protein